MGGRLSSSFRECLGTHAVLNGKHAGLEAFAFLWMALLGRMGRNRSGLLCKFKIGVAGKVSLLHQRVTRERRSNAEFLLLQSI